MIKKRIPIFIISYNRLTVLKRSINSYLSFVDYSDIIIVDKGSCYEPLKEYYFELAQKGTKVIYSDPLQKKDSLSNISEEVENHKKQNQFDYYIVTDPDICMEEVNLDVLDLYTFFLDIFPDIEIVGPMLRIIDIPENYPAREWCWKRHVDLFWHKIPEVLYWKNKKIHYQFAPIDTTFGVIRSTTRYKRLLNGIRIYAPYEATHLDWYITDNNMTEDQQFYMKTSNPDVAHWCGPWYRSPPQEKLLVAEREIFIVEKVSDADFMVSKHLLP